MVSISFFLYFKKCPEISNDDNTKTDTVAVTVATPVCTLVARNSQAETYKVKYQKAPGTPEYWTRDKYRCIPGDGVAAKNFYVLSATNAGDDYKVSLIAEQNITGLSTMNWANAMSYLGTNNYSKSPQSNALWNKVDSVTLPTAQQIAIAGKTYNLTYTSHYGAISSNLDNSNISKFSWLYDYTKNCKTEGCNYETTSGAAGYWTSTSVTTGESPTSVATGRNGFLSGISDASITYAFGVRPVITLSSLKILQ